MYNLAQAHNDAVTNVLFSPDGRWITSSSVDSTVKVDNVFDILPLLMMTIGCSYGMLVAAI